MPSAGRPLVGVPCDDKLIQDLPYQAVAEKYLTALMDQSGVQPLCLLAGTDIPSVLPLLDGVLLPGSPSNIEPHHYDGPASPPGSHADPGRDGLVLPLIKEVLRHGMPLFAICRGFQELNVALGGTLHAHIENVPAPEGYAPRLPHAEELGKPAEERYAPRHEVALVPGGLLDRLVGPGPIHVNSLHGQAIDRLAATLIPEAWAADGLVEAARTATGFALGVQWHPDWRTGDTPHYAALFQAFGNAARDHARSRRTLMTGARP